MTAPVPITGIRTVSIPVDDQDAALAFYTGTLGFTLLRDNPAPNGGRWIELAAGSNHAIVTLEPAVQVRVGVVGQLVVRDGEPARVADGLDLPRHPARWLGGDVVIPHGPVGLHQPARRVDLEVLTLDQRPRRVRVRHLIGGPGCPG